MRSWRAGVSTYSASTLAKQIVTFEKLACLGYETT